MHAGGLLRLREPSVAHRSTDLLPLQFRALPPQIPGKDSDPQQQDKQQGYRQGRRLPVHSAAQQKTHAPRTAITNTPNVSHSARFFISLP